MDAPLIYRLLADVVLVTHVAFVAFVICGLILVFAGGMRRWGWVRNPWFRLLHLAAIAIVVVQAWAGVVCPLTTLEMALRNHAGDAVYAGSFIAHWLQQILYVDAPAWVFIVAYSVFGAVVVASWLLVRPRPF